MATLPVFQMILVPGADNSWGLKFSVELGGNEFAQPVFVIPFAGIEHPQNHTFIMPGEINGEYRNYTLSLENNLLVINDDLLGYPVSFSFGGLSKNSLNLFEELIFPEMHFGYIGNQNANFFFNLNSNFVIIHPMDLLVMDKLYRDYQACFVGYTPVFGVIDNIYFDNY